jgi:hypothetical protein
MPPQVPSLFTNLAMGGPEELLALKMPEIFIDLSFEQREILAASTIVAAVFWVTN